MKSFEHRFEVDDPDNIEVTKGFGEREVYLRIEDVTLQFSSFDSFKTFMTILNDRSREFEENQLERINGKI